MLVTTRSKKIDARMLAKIPVPRHAQEAPRIGTVRVSGFDWRRDRHGNLSTHNISKGRVA